jgi:hypothetical protein
MEKTKSTEYIRSMFRELGLISALYGFESIIPNENFIEEVEKFNTDSANMLRFSPDLFIMPAHVLGIEEQKENIVKKQIFFIKILMEPKILTEEMDILNKFYKETNFFFIFLDFKNKKILIDKLQEMNLKNMDIIKVLLEMQLSQSPSEIERIVSKYTNLIFD